MDLTSKTPPRENLVRAVQPGISVRADGEDDANPILFGHFARFNEPTEIDSMFEGHFMETIAPGAFRKTLREGRDSIKLLFQHGMDPAVGDKPIGAIRNMAEDDTGASYEADLFRGLPDLVLDGLRAGQYGASFRFSVMRETWDRSGKATDENPDGLAVRTIKEAQVREFGPVTFPAYAGASAGVRSLSDDFIFRAFAQEPERLAVMFDEYVAQRGLHVDPAPAPVVINTTVNTLDPADPATLAAIGSAAEAGAAAQEEELREEPIGLADVTPATDTTSEDPAAPAATDDDDAEPEQGADDEPEAERRDEQQPALSDEDADPPVTSPDERRETRRPPLRPLRSGGKRPIYGLSRKETSKPWLLGPSKTTKQN